MARSHWRFVVRDQYGFVIQNAQVFVYQPGTTTVFTGIAYDAVSGGSVVTNPFTSNAFGEVEAWFDTRQSVDVKVTDNSNTAYRAVGGVSSTVDFADFTEKDEISATPEDESISNHGASSHDATSSDNPHGAGDHTDITRSVFLAPEAAAMDGGTLSTLGTTPDIVRTISLADALTQGAYWNVHVPSDWVSGAISVQIFVAGATTTTGALRWRIVTNAIESGVDVSSAGTTVTFTGATITTQRLLLKEAAQAGETPAAANDFYKVNIARIGGDGADTYAAAAHVVGVLLTYTANQ